MMRCLLLLSLLLAIQTEFSVFASIKGLTVKTGARTGENYHFGAEDLGSDAVEVKANGAPEPKAAKKTTKIGTSTYFALNAYDGEATKCFAVHDNTEYEIYPNMTLPNAEREYSECSFTLKSTDWQHAGPWTIKGSFVDDNSNETTPSEFSTDYELTVYKTVQVEPASKIAMTSGYASFYLSTTFDNADSCRLTSSKNGHYDLLGNALDPKDGIELYKTCGVRMHYNESRVGTWMLVQSTNSYQEIRASFAIEGLGKDILPMTHRKFWERGTSESLEVRTLHSEPVDIYCDVVKPDGTVIPLSDKSCKYQLDAVSDVHAGVWKGRFGVRHSMTLIEDEYIVEVWNPEAVEISVSTEADRILILCRTGVDYLNTCVFESPNGTLLSLQGAMGDGHYEYNGTGFLKESTNGLPKKAECGLTIRDPLPHDYGLWTCSMRKKNAITRGRINVVDPKKKSIAEAIISHSAVYVKRGDSFTIKCTSNAPLNYCWLQSPNGTMYSVTKSGSGGNLLRYNGEGLSMGVCGAIVENADDTYNGDWSCRLGVVGAAEVESIVPVTVTESRLIPSAETMMAHQGKTAILSCRTFPSNEATIDYCRWVRPNGHGIYQDTMSRYVSHQDNTTCTLKLAEVTDEDRGTWTCLARLSTGSDEEVWSKLVLITGTPQLSGASNTTLHIVSIVLLVTTIICGTFVVIALHRRKKRRSPPPPAYDINYAFPNDPELKVIPNFNNIDSITHFEKSFKQ